MNNNQFRKLLSDTPGRENDGSSSSRPGATPAFGAKRASFMPMTPRTVQGGVDVDFARQVRERNAALQPRKKFKSSAAPKGTKFAKGYTDRARAREEAGDGEDDRAARIKALEEQMKLGQISMEMFETLRDQITGGEASSTHLVKGLDRKLLERVKRGEDVLGVGGGDAMAAKEPSPDVDEELDKLGEKEVETLKRGKAEKKGMMAPPPLAGKKRSRDEIMAELKAQREAAAKAKAAPQLDARWRKVGEKEKSRIEIDHKGREVLVTVDEDGVVKKKVRKMPAKVTDELIEEAAYEMPDASKAVLGADAALPDAPVSQASVEDEDDDIFEGVGTEYNPLGDMADSDEDDDDSDQDAPPPSKPSERPPASAPALAGSEDESDEGEIPDSADLPPSSDSPEEPQIEEGVKTKPPARHSYFADTPKTTEETHDHFAGIQSVLKKATQLGKSEDPADDDAREGETEEAHQARIKRRAQMLAQQDRDLEDMDMGFGGSRLEDEADVDEEGMKIKLSEWKQGRAADGNDDDDGGKGGREKKKRKPKKRKGDVNSAADIMRVIEGRKGK